MCTVQTEWAWAYSGSSTLECGSCRPYPSCLSRLRCGWWAWYQATRFAYSIAVSTIGSAFKIYRSFQWLRHISDNSTTQVSIVSEPMTLFQSPGSQNSYTGNTTTVHICTYRDQWDICYLCRCTTHALPAYQASVFGNGLILTWPFSAVCCYWYP